MEKTPMQVRLVGKHQDFCNIQFPNLQIPVQVNDDLYKRMLKSSEYRFIGDS
jgi:hypothetical protein